MNTQHSSDDSSAVLALVDCNNFFVSCERVFRPDLEGRPVVVLSNNDGCVVSRSNEAKALKVPMGAPVFQLREQIRQHKIVTLSSNYELYADMSRRVFDTLRQLNPLVEQYSIDEAFLDLSWDSDTLDTVAQHLRNTVYLHTGIPVSIGIAHTKTLAKAANELSKTDPLSPGWTNWSDSSPEHQQHVQRVLEMLPIQDVWGVGWSMAPKLHKLGITTAAALALAPESTLQLVGKTPLIRTSRELRGIACHAIEPASTLQHSICCSKMFGRPVTSTRELIQAASVYLDTACQKLREQNGAAQDVTVFFHTKRHAEYSQRHFVSQTCLLDHPSQFPPDFLAAIKPVITTHFDPQKHYSKLGVTLGKIRKNGQEQLSLLTAAASSNQNHQPLLQALDNTRARYKSLPIGFGASAFTHRWESKHNLRTLRASTRLDEIITAV